MSGLPLYRMLKMAADKANVSSVLPVLPKCQLHTRNGIISQGSGVPGIFTSLQDELPPQTNINYYENVTGWQRYEISTQEEDHFSYPSASNYNIPRWNDNIQVNAHVSLTRSPTRYPEPALPEPSPSPLSLSSAVTYAKSRFDWSKHGEPPRTNSTEKIANDKLPENLKIVEDIPSVTLTSDRLAKTTLLEAVKFEDTTVLCDLLNEHITDDVNATDVNGRTVLSYLVMKNCSPLLEKILKLPNLDVNKSDNEGNTPLHFSAQAGQVEALSLLLNSCSGVEVDARNIFGFTPLMKAALQGRTRCAKLLLFAGASPTMRDTGRGLRAEQWARYCGRYTCADVIEKYARSQLLSKTASYGNWGGEPELGIHFVNGRLQPPAIALQNALNLSYKNNSIKSKLKKAFHHTNPTNWNSSSKVNSFSLVTQLTSAALCVSSPVLPNSSKVSPVVKSLMKPFVIPKVEITPDSDGSPDHSTKSLDSEVNSRTSHETNTKSGRRLSYLIKLRKKSYF